MIAGGPPSSARELCAHSIRCLTPTARSLSSAATMLYARSLVVALCLAGVSVDAWQVAVKPQLNRVAPRAAVPLLQAAAAAAGDEDVPTWPEVLQEDGTAPILTKRSMLDTTEKFDEIAAGAASSGSAAAALGREPGTCDPYDPKSSDFCMDDTEKVWPSTRGGCNPGHGRLQPYAASCSPVHACPRASWRST